MINFVTLKIVNYFIIFYIILIPYFSGLKSMVLISDINLYKNIPQNLNKWKNEEKQYTYNMIDYF